MPDYTPMLNIDASKIQAAVGTLVSDATQAISDTQAAAAAQAQQDAATIKQLQSELADSQSNLIVLPHLEQQPWEDDTAVPSVAHLPLTRSTLLKGNRRDFIFNADQAFAGTLHVLKLAELPSATRFFLEVQQLAGNSNCNCFETDLKIPRNGKMYDGSFQLYLGKGPGAQVAQVYDTSSGKGHWADALNIRIDPTSITAVMIEYLLLADAMVYVAVTINGERFPLGHSFPLVATPWQNRTIIQMQSAVITPGALTRSVWNVSLAHN